MLRSFIAFLLFIAAFGIPLIVFGDTPDRSDGETDRGYIKGEVGRYSRDNELLRQLWSRDRDKRLKARDAIIAERDRLVGQLIRIIAEERTEIYPDPETGEKKKYRVPDPKLAAAFMLAYYRAPEAVSVLLDNIELNEELEYGRYFRRGIDLKTGKYESRPEEGPFVYTLVEIGKPAVAGLFRRDDKEVDKDDDVDWEHIRDFVLNAVERIPLRDGPALAVNPASYPKYRYPDLLKRYESDEWLDVVNEILDSTGIPREVGYRTSQACEKIRSGYRAIGGGAARNIRTRDPEDEPYHRDDPKTLSYEIAGKYRRDDSDTLRFATNDLVYRDPAYPDKPPGFGPAADYLVAVGKPAVAMIVERLRHEIDETIFESLTRVLQRIEGKAGAESFLRQLLKADTRRRNDIFRLNARRMGRLLTGIGEYSADIDGDGVADELGSVEGCITNALNGEYIVGVEVAIVNEVGRATRVVSTDEEGGYKALLQAGLYCVKLSHESGKIYHNFEYYVDVKAGETVFQDAELVPLETEESFIFGRVIDGISKEPLRDKRVSISSRNGQTQTAITDQSGRFHVVVREQGSYAISCEVDGYLPGSRYMRGDASVHVSEGRSSVVVLKKWPYAAVFGRVTDAVTGKPVKGVCVPTSGEMRRSRIEGMFDITDENGEYEFICIVGAVEFNVGSMHFFADAIPGGDRRRVVKVPREGLRFDFEVVVKEGSSISGKILERYDRQCVSADKFMARLIALVPRSGPTPAGLPDGRVSMIGLGGYGGSRGSYWLNVAPGEYRILLSSPMCHPVVSDLIPVDAVDAVELDMSLGAKGGPAMMSGTLRNAETNEAIDVHSGHLGPFVHFYPVAWFDRGWFVIGYESHMRSNNKYRTEIARGGTFTIGGGEGGEAGTPEYKPPDEFYAGSWLITVDPVEGRRSLFAGYSALVDVRPGMNYKDIHLRPIVKKNVPLAIRLTVAPEYKTIILGKMLHVYVYNGGVLVLHETYQPQNLEKPWVLQVPDGELTVFIRSQIGRYEGGPVKVARGGDPDDFFSETDILRAEIELKPTACKPK